MPTHDFGIDITNITVDLTWILDILPYMEVHFCAKNVSVDMELKYNMSPWCTPSLVLTSLELSEGRIFEDLHPNTLEISQWDWINIKTISKWLTFTLFNIRQQASMSVQWIFLLVQFSKCIWGVNDNDAPAIGLLNISNHNFSFTCYYR